MGKQSGVRGGERRMTVLAGRVDTSRATVSLALALGAEIQLGRGCG
jgi:hypothetical protein